MTTVAKYTIPGAAGAEVHTRAQRDMSTKGGTYQEAVHVVLAADPEGGAFLLELHLEAARKASH